MWEYIHRITNLTFLLLAITLVVKLSGSTQDNQDFTSFSLEISALRTEMRDALKNTITYSEQRVNALSGTQDSFQVSTSARITMLEKRIGAVEQENKNLKYAQKQTINNTINNNNKIEGQ